MTSTDIQKWIDETDNILLNAYRRAADEMVTKIMSTFDDDRIKPHLTRYNCEKKNDLKDLEYLRGYLYYQLENFETCESPWKSTKFVFGIQTRIKQKDYIMGKPRMAFISHSTEDKVYTDALVNLLFALGLEEDEIVCTSFPNLGIPLGKNIYDYLVEKFQENSLHVIFMLSQNYYKSVACLNEMGAAWALKQKWDAILLPGFDFSEIKGCIDKE